MNPVLDTMDAFKTLVDSEIPEFLGGIKLETDLLTKNQTDISSDSEKMPVFLSRTPSPDSIGDNSTPLKRPDDDHVPKISAEDVDTNTPSHTSISGPEMATSAENVLMKKRLVEQFYKMEGKAPRALDAGVGALGASLTDLNRESRPGSGGGIVNFSGSVIGSGIGSGIGPEGVLVAPFDEGVLATRDYASPLLSRSVSMEIELEKLAHVLTQAISVLEREPRLTEPLPSGRRQLARVQQHVHGVRQLVDVMTALLSETLSGAKKQYHEQTQRSVAKVTRLSGLLESLAERVDGAKSNMASSRDMLETQIAAKTAVLEHVAARFDAYDLANRHRRVRQGVAALAFLAAAAAVYMALWGQRGLVSG